MLLLERHHGQPRFHAHAHTFQGLPDLLHRDIGVVYDNSGDFTLQIRSDAGRDKEPLGLLPDGLVSYDSTTMFGRELAWQRLPGRTPASPPQRVESQRSISLVSNGSRGALPPWSSSSTQPSPRARHWPHRRGAQALPSRRHPATVHSALAPPWSLVFS
uniref:Uncharacterized protein n=1 Tax=Arundo donax TaxID=35708 RepID=A0A0A9BQ54_ARUDO